LSIAKCHTFIQDKIEISPLVNILSDSSQDENPKANILASDDEVS
jgi:hypothetical protein